MSGCCTRNAKSQQLPTGAEDERVTVPRAVTTDLSGPLLDGGTSETAWLQRSFPKSRLFAARTMGRAGLEPATLGLKVLIKKVTLGDVFEVFWVALLALLNGLCDMRPD